MDNTNKNQPQNKIMNKTTKKSPFFFQDFDVIFQFVSSLYCFVVGMQF